VSKTVQSLLPVKNLPIDDKEVRQLASELDCLLKNIYTSLKSRFRSLKKFEDVLIHGKDYKSKDLTPEQDPEAFARKIVIEPILEFLGYSVDVTEGRVRIGIGEFRKPDYEIKTRDGLLLYVEAEPLNAKLSKTAEKQVGEWLFSKASESNYAIATNGFEWVVYKFDDIAKDLRIVHSVDIRDLLISYHAKSLASTIDLLEKKYGLLALHSKVISALLEEVSLKVEEQKEEITKKFYNDYVRYVFGLDEKGKKLKERCLIDEICVPPEVEEDRRGLFAVILMNRLIFIKFLEEKGIVPPDFLRKLLNEYRSQKSVPLPFYEAYLKPLFYEVFNTAPDERKDYVKRVELFREIPYLNGGLFRPMIDKEEMYSVNDDGLIKVIENLLEKYSFTLSGEDSESINPDILGYIFERTINFISGAGTNEQKMKGAYYTPNDVVSFIVKKTLYPVLHKKILNALREAGWSDKDLEPYRTLEDIFRNPPKNPVYLEKIIEAIDDVKVLDPACGSGHFLTVVLNELLRIKEYFLKVLGVKEVDRFKLKRDIVAKNIYGVDIDENAVEIAKLRLWLAIIEEVEDKDHIDTLPNIDFNIITGNSLVGWLDEDVKFTTVSDLLNDDYVRGALEGLRAFYGQKIDEVITLLKFNTPEKVAKAYRKLMELYTTETGVRAVRLRDLLENLRDRMYEAITGPYCITLRLKNKFVEDIKKRRPFHWRFDFGSILEDGGFDVVIGNPPYIEDGNYDKVDLQIIKKHYFTGTCGNTHAYFAERAIKLLKKGGYFGFIVPLSIVSTDRMAPIREFLRANSSRLEYYNFDDRPGKIFSGLEHCRSTIVIAEKGNGTKVIVTSKYHRWYTKDRPKLFECLQTVEWKIENGEIIPKIGTEIEKGIISKLRESSGGKRVGDFLLDKERKDTRKIWFHNAPQYWIHAHPDELVPKIKYYRVSKKGSRIVLGEQIGEKISDQYVPLIVKKEHADVLLALLNSSLFYWWFVIWSDGRHLLLQHIREFPLDLASFSDEEREP
jgi:type I restriction-modification system DNA methylase subunit